MDWQWSTEEVRLEICLEHGRVNEECQVKEKRKREEAGSWECDERHENLPFLLQSFLKSVHISSIPFLPICCHFSDHFITLPQYPFPSFHVLFGGGFRITFFLSFEVVDVDGCSVYKFESDVTEALHKENGQNTRSERRPW